MDMARILFSWLGPVALGVVALAGRPAHGADESAESKAQLVTCDAAKYDELRQQHGVFVAWFHAPWCPTCLKQQKALKKLVAEGVSGAPYICQFDFESTEALQESIGVSSQSTMVRYEGGSETSRLRGESKPERLKKFLEGP